MEIKSTNRLMRAYVDAYHHYPRDVCSYVRGLTKLAFKLLFATGWFTFLFLVVSHIFIISPALVVLDLWTNGGPIALVAGLYGEGFVEIFLHGGFVVIVVTLLVLLYNFFRLTVFRLLLDLYYFLEDAYDRRPKPLPKLRQPNVFVQFVKDKHAKVCTTIQVTHD